MLACDDTPEDGAGMGEMQECLGEAELQLGAGMLHVLLGDTPGFIRLSLKWSTNLCGCFLLCPNFVPNDPCKEL